MLFRNNNRSKSIFVTVFAFFFGLFCLCVSPVYGNSEDNIRFSVNANSVLSITIDASSADFSMDLNPDTGNLYTGSVSINVGTNNPLGYSLYMKMTSSSLVNNKVNPAAYINSIPSNVASSSFPTNAWGYSIDNGSNFKTIPTSGSGDVVSTSSASVATQAVSIMFGSKIDENTVAGSYVGSASFQIVANTLGD